MTEPIVDFSDPPRRRGRPRSPDAIERDRRVLDVLTQRGPRTKDQLVEEIKIKPSLVYLALWRLKHVGQVEHTSADDARYVWRVVS